MNFEKLFKKFKTMVDKFELIYRKEDGYSPLYILRAGGICIPSHYQIEGNNLSELLNKSIEDVEEECKNDF